MLKIYYIFFSVISFDKISIETTSGKKPRKKNSIINIDYEKCSNFQIDSIFTGSIAKNCSKPSPRGRFFTVTTTSDLFELTEVEIYGTEINDKYQYIKPKYISGSPVSDVIYQRYEKIINGKFYEQSWNSYVSCIYMRNENFNKIIIDFDEWYKVEEILIEYPPKSSKII